MLLGTHWLKQAKVHHDWGNNVLTITTKYITITQAC